MARKNTLSRAIAEIRATEIPAASLAPIPRLLHQTFRSKTSLPPQLQANVDVLRSTNPLWSHSLYDDNDQVAFIAEHFGADVLSLYLRIDDQYGVARADLFRYLCVYKFGGIYIDIKSGIGRPLDELSLSNERYLISQWRNGKGEAFEGIGLPRELSDIPGGEYQQWFIVSSPGHPFLSAVIQRVLRNIDAYALRGFGVGESGVWNVTGPIAYTRAINPILGRYPHRRTDITAEYSFEYTTFSKAEMKPEHGFPTHYSLRKSPIVRLTLLQKLHWYPRWWGQRVVRKFAKVARSHGD